MASADDRAEKSPRAFRTISEVSELLGVQQHVLRFWETRFPAVAPLKRGGNRRFYRPEDVQLLRAINRLLYTHGYTIRGVQKLIEDLGAPAVARQYGEAEAGEGSEADVALATDVGSATGGQVKPASPAGASPTRSEAPSAPADETAASASTPGARLSPEVRAELLAIRDLLAAQLEDA